MCAGVEITRTITVVPFDSHTASDQRPDRALVKSIRNDRALGFGMIDPPACDTVIRTRGDFRANGCPRQRHPRDRSRAPQLSIDRTYVSERSSVRTAHRHCVLVQRFTCNVGSSLELTTASCVESMCQTNNRRPVDPTNPQADIHHHHERTNTRARSSTCSIRFIVRHSIHLSQCILLSADLRCCASTLRRTLTRSIRTHGQSRRTHLSFVSR
jgi:hypothetical protein